MDNEGQQRCHGSCDTGRPRVDPAVQAWAAVSRPPTLCNTNGHLANSEVREVASLINNVTCLRFEETGYTTATLAVDNDMRAAYRANATPWEVRFSRILNPLIGRGLLPGVQANPITRQGAAFDNRLLDSVPIIDDRNNAVEVVGHVTIEMTSDIFLQQRDVHGTVLSSQLIGTRPLEPDEIGNALAAIVVTLGVGLVRSLGAAALGRVGATQLTLNAARGLTSDAFKRVLLFLRALRARSIVRAFQAAGKKVIVNIGGEAGKEEVDLFGEHIALNHQVRMSATRRFVPNLVKEPGENIGQVFERESVDRVVSRKVDHTFDTDRVARGAFDVLKPGGDLSMNVFPDASPGAPSPFADKFMKSLTNAGFKDVKNIGNVQFFAKKP